MFPAFMCAFLVNVHLSILHMYAVFIAFLTFKIGFVDLIVTTRVSFTW